MRMLFLGDIVGHLGRQAVLGLVPTLREQRKLDVVIANCENAAAGRGITPSMAEELLAGGVDVLTGGNHIWDVREIEAMMASDVRMVRPANHQNVVGRGWTRIALKDGRTLGVIQVEGRVFMAKRHACPFEAARKCRQDMGEVSASLLDVHAEATSEKQALAWHMDGFVSAVVGTHTHVQTADERILPQGTALLTDAGMCGPYDSVVGLEKSEAVERFLTGRRSGHPLGTENVWLCGVIIDTDDASGKANHIERVREAWPTQARKDDIGALLSQLCGRN